MRRTRKHREYYNRDNVTKSAEDRIYAAGITLAALLVGGGIYELVKYLKKIFLLAALFLSVQVNAQNGKPDEYAWKTLKFGQTEKEFKKLVPKGVEELNGYVYAAEAFYNEKGQLYGIKLTGGTSGTDITDFAEYVSLPAMNLRALIAEKYGPGNRHSDIPMNAEGFPAGENSLHCHSWLIGDKAISVVVLKNESGLYQAACYIQHVGMVQEYDKYIKVDKFKDDSNKF